MIKSLVFKFISHKGCTIWLEKDNVRLWGFFRGAWAIFKNDIEIALQITHYQRPCDVTLYGSCHDAAISVRSKIFP